MQTEGVEQLLDVRMVWFHYTRELFLEKLSKLCF